MPILKDKAIRIPHVWLEIPLKATKDIPKPKEYYLIPMGVAKYIKKLEKQLI